MAMNGDKRDRTSRKVYKRASHARVRTALRAMLRSGIDCDPPRRMALPDLTFGRKVPIAAQV